MNKELSKLYPSKLWENFANICDVPHPSKHEGKLLEWLKSFAKANDLEYYQDAIGNMIFRKAATPGMENRTPVILQAHMDMVPQANSDKKHDFTVDPIEPIIGADGWVRANGTTLGADNGIGGSAALAVLVSKEVKHGPIEVLLTVDEETGMTGAFNLEPGVLKGKILLNLDSETEGELYIGCAGGLDASFNIPFKTMATPEGMQGVELTLNGLNGGHSGMEINLGRANANKVMTRLVKKLSKDYGFVMSQFNGGNMRNAIPREAHVQGVIPTEKMKAAKSFITQFSKIVKSEFAATEPNLKLALTLMDAPAKVMTVKDMHRVLNAIFAIPNGVMRMSDSMENLVETSNNLAIVKTNKKSVEIFCLMRSSVDSAKDALADRMTAIAELTGATIELTGGYPGWKPNMDSPILNTMQSVYRKKFKGEAKIQAIHAGLECGLFGVSYDWDMISFGPTIVGPHSPAEKVNIESVGKFWDFLVETLKNVPVK
ncbi:MAG: aminoacyl-histidine dipeptidase [Bacteroidales bacterium]|nr:aminoacyl-histidine dipeptidase [Bacteroidales bacterium]